MLSIKGQNQKHFYRKRIAEIQAYLVNPHVQMVENVYGKGW